MTSIGCPNVEFGPELFIPFKNKIKLQANLNLFQNSQKEKKVWKIWKNKKVRFLEYQQEEKRLLSTTYK